MDSEFKDIDGVEKEKTIEPMDLTDFMRRIFDSDKIRFTDYLLKKIQSTST